MEGIANVAQQQQTHGSTSKTVGAKEQVAQPVKQDIIKEIQKKVADPETKINSEQDVKDLVQKLNKAIEPMSTSLSFGVDTNNIFYVAVKETDSQKLIRRFPAEQAADFLPKMQEVTGILFDSKG